VYEITVATAYFAMIQDGVHEEFVHTVDINRARLFEGACRILVVIVGKPWFDVRNMESWEKVGRIWDVERDCGGIMMDINDLVRTVVSRHKFGCLVLALKFVVLATV
jgi:hypothetical protein